MKEEHFQTKNLLLRFYAFPFWQVDFTRVFNTILLWPKHASLSCKPWFLFCFLSLLSSSKLSQSLLEYASKIIWWIVCVMDGEADHNFSKLFQKHYYYVCTAKEFNCNMPTLCRFHLNVHCSSLVVCIRYTGLCYSLETYERT